MAYLGNAPVVGDSTNSFKLLDDIASFTLTFDATDTSVVSISGDTLTFRNHRFLTGQRVTYTDGGGTAIGGLTDGTAYFIIKVDQNTIQLATNASNAAAGTAIDLTSGAAGGSHTLNVAFDSINTKFSATHSSGTKAAVSRAGQISLSINGVIQQPQDTGSPTVGYGVLPGSIIIFSTAPATTDKVFGTFIGETAPSFDITDNTVDNFTGDGSTTSFNLSRDVPSSNDVLVTLDGVTQYPTDSSATRSYAVIESTLTFVSAPATGVAIQVRHIGFAGATTSAVTGFYGRQGNAALTSTDDISVQNISGVGATFTSNVNIEGVLTYEDVTNVDSIGIITARAGVLVGSGITLSKDGDVFFTGIATGNGSGLTALNASNLASGTVPTARLGSGTASSSTFLRGDSTFATVTSTTINNNADNLVITGSGTANTLEAESGFTFNGSGVQIGTGNPFIHLKDTTNNTDAYVQSDDNGSLYLKADDNAESGSSKIVLQVDGSEKVRIDSSGRLLVGTTTSDAHTAADDIVIAKAGKVGITLNSTDSDASHIYFADSASNPGAYAGYFEFHHGTDTLKYGTGNNERLRIASDGSMGLGTTPETDGQASSLYFANGNANIWGSGNVNLYTVVNARYTGSAWKYNNTAVASYVGQQSGVWSFHNAPSGTADATATFTERFRITSAGLVGIGENTPLAQLHIKPASNMSQLLLEQNNATDGYALFQDGPNGGHLKFMRHINGSETQTLLLRSDGGLCFGTDNGAGNALDDYEEGTFTTEVVQGLGTLSATYDSTGRYTKIGRFVHVQAIIQFGGVGNGTQVRLKLPFTHVTSTALGGGVISFTNVGGLDGQSTLTLIGASGQSYCAVQNKNSNPTISGTQNNQAIYYHFSYEAA